VEGTGSYGAGLARYLTGCGTEVAEVIRPNRQARRQRGKSDAADAVAAALRNSASARPAHASKQMLTVVEQKHRLGRAQPVTQRFHHRHVAVLPDPQRLHHLCRNQLGAGYTGQIG